MLPHRWPRCSLGLPPWCALTPSCHSKANSFIYVELPHNPVILAPLYPHSHFQTALLGLVRYTPAFLCSFFTFISSVYSPNSTCPLLALFLSLLHHSSCKHLIIPYLLFLFSPISHCPPPSHLPLFTASLHLLLPFASLHLFFILLTSMKPHIVCLSGVLIPNVEKMWEIN